jgi:hypothetical protein
MLFVISFSTCYRVCKRTAWILIRLHMHMQAGLDPCWSQTQYVGFVMILSYILLFLTQHEQIYQAKLHPICFSTYFQRVAFLMVMSHI